MVKRSRCKINVCQLFRCLANMLSGAFWLQSGNLGKDDAAAAIDSDELADCVSRVSIVAAQWCDDIDQIDINSVIALSGGAMAVDGLILPRRVSLEDAAVRPTIGAGDRAGKSRIIKAACGHTYRSTQWKDLFRISKKGRSTKAADARSRRLTLFSSPGSRGIPIRCTPTRCFRRKAPSVYASRTAP